MDQLIERLRAAGLIDENDCIVLERYEDGYQAVEVSIFRSMFDDALTGVEPGGEFAALIEADNSRGYSRFFQAWRQMGLL